MRRTLLILVTVALLFGCAPSQSTVTLAGSTSVQPLAEVLAEAYHRAGGERVRIQGGGSAAGIRAVQDGVADVGAVSRYLLADEAVGLHTYLVAWDALVVVVHPSNAVQALSSAQVRQIFSGAVRTWPDGRPIRVITREHGSGTREAMATFLRPALIAPRALVMNANGAIRAAVAADPQAVGYVSLASLADGGVRPVLIDGIEPSLAHVRSGRYPLSRPFLFLTKGESDFVRFALSAQGQAIVRREGLVPSQ